VWGRKNEEYIADFESLTRRALTPEEHKFFRLRYILGADWKLTMRQYKLDRGFYFHMLYRIEEKLGRACREMEPFALFPLDEYFQGSTRVEPELLRAGMRITIRNRNRLVPPLSPRLDKAA
jgi:hypothetical protein